jgi:Tn3 transposase DDE domain
MPCLENQRYRASGLNLTIAAIVPWNTIYLSHAIAELRAQGEPRPISCSAHMPRSAGNTSALIATTSGHSNRSSRDFGRCEIRTLPSSMPLTYDLEQILR